MRLGLLCGYLVARRHQRRNHWQYNDVSQWFHSIHLSSQSALLELRYLVPPFVGIGLWMLVSRYLLPVPLFAGTSWFGYVCLCAAALHAFNALFVHGGVLKLIHGKAMRDRKVTIFATRAVLEVATGVFLIML